MPRRKVTEHVGVYALKLWFDQNQLDLNPDYQRDEVWTRPQKQLLVDSLLTGIDVPKLYFRAIDHDGYLWEVVDGQQRLRTIFEFMAGDFTLPAEQPDIEGHQVAGLTFNQLPQPLQTTFLGATLDVVELLEGYSDDVIDEVFYRLQNGTPLNAAEKRRVLPATCGMS